MTPVLITPPARPIVLLDDLAAHLRLDADDDLALVEQLGEAATAMIDGWTGVLGRCVMPQVWQGTVDAAGEVVLPMPDVTAAEVDYGDGPVALAVTASAAGPVVTVTGAGTVTFTCALPDRLLPQAQLIVKFLVAAWYANREAATADDVPKAAAALIATLRWGHL
jgi:hypothetical protein